MKYSIGIDIGGQSAKIGIVDPNGNIIIQDAVPSTQNSFSEFLNCLVNKINHLTTTSNIDKENIIGIGVGAPNGNIYTGTIDNAANLIWGKGSTINLVDELQNSTNLPVTLTNDANAAAMGEMIYGAAKGMKNFIMITLGTGVGSGIVINGDVVYGHDGLAGELGHVSIIKENGRSCGCGKTGCLETYTSASGVALTAKTILKESDKNSILRDINPNNITSKDVYNAAIQGDELAIQIFNYTGNILGQAMADFVAFSSPEAIILFGGLTKAGHLIYKPITESFNDNLIPFWKNKIKVLNSALPESNAAILGASALAHKK